MNIGERIHGFTVRRAKYISEVAGALYELRHEKHGTPLVFLDREDTNKSFYIAFKTLPEDDTGVFHIIEHSVLCGSRKFPVKEPFVELLKSSLKTFLNAMTYPDRTVYPVSSRCDRDFFNLVDVYMDAVFHPLMRENEFIFMQEGHRLEISEEDGSLSRNGVVYNEMKGSVSSPDELSADELMRMLYPGTVFEKSSGGEPGAIPELTYDGFCRAHEKYYHPSNAYVFLDGRVALDEILPLIDAYLSEFPVRAEKFHVGDDPGIICGERTVEYELSPEEAPEGKTRAYIGVRGVSFDDVQTGFELSVLTDAIAGSNEAPFKKALLASGLVEDVCIFPLGDGIKFGSYAIELKNVKDGAVDETLELAENKLKELARDGIDRELLEASLNMREFRLREKDFGSLPRGLVYGLAALDGWIYGASPKTGLCYEDVVALARERLGTDHYAGLLDKIFVKNERKAKLTLLPSPSLGEKRAREERERMEEIRRSLSDGELASLKERLARFGTWQSAPDTAENLDTLPTLSISDIPKDADVAPTEEREYLGAKVLTHDLPTDGISYVELYFDVSDLDEKELQTASLLAALLGKCGTAKYPAGELAKIKKSRLGALYATPTVFKKDGRAIPYIQVFASMLDKNRRFGQEILDEIINSTSFDDKSTVRNVVKQRIISMREGFISSGHAAAIRRAGSYVNPVSAVLECFFGIEMYRSLIETDRELDRDPCAVFERLSALLKRIATRARLTVGFTGAPDEKFINTLASIPKSAGSAPVSRKTEPFGIKNEGVIIPSRVSYIGKAATLDAIGESFTGSMHVLANILSYTHLWNSIRVRGGAYGAGFSVRASGGVFVYSYRDPSPSASIAAADGSAEFLRELAQSGESLDGYIIGAFGDYDALSSPRTKGSEATGLALSGKTHEDERRVRESMLSFDKAELERLADVTERLMSTNAVCVFGPKEQLDTCRSRLKEFIEI